MKIMKMKELIILLGVFSFAFAGNANHDGAVSPENFELLETKALSDLFQTSNSSKLSLINELLAFSEEQADDIADLILQDYNISDFSAALLKDHPYSRLNVLEIIEMHEYKAEKHSVETEDGYILEMHRITGNKSNPDPDGKPVVFLMHGILASSSDWVLAGPQRGLAFLLADAGYDVWMGNARGNRYSRNHRSIGSKKRKFWQFSWHEIGVYDLPAMIDYAIEQTGSKNVTYVGHSQGSTVFLVMLSERPEYNPKIKMMFSLAPVAYCANMYNPVFKYIAKFEKQLRLTLTPLGPWEILPNRGLYKIVSRYVCKGKLKSLCSNIMFMVSGFNKEQLEDDLIPAITAHLPAGSSMYQFFHYGQLINTEHFRKFDHNYIGSSNPPSYNFENIKAPISLHFGRNDWLSDEKDVQKLHSKLPNSIGISVVPNEKFNHLDFLYAKDVKTLLYNDIMAVMSKYRD